MSGTEQAGELSRAAAAGLWLELAVVFIALPLGFDRLLRSGYRALLFPGLWLLALGAAVVLFRDPTFDAQQLFAVPWRHTYVRVVLVKVVVAVVALAMVARRSGSGADDIPCSLRLLIAVFYPLLSVVPQGLVWRVFFVHRYAALFGSGVGMLAASAAAFAFAHIIFRNRLALAFTLIGGAVFAHTYLVTGSMLLANFEHAVAGLAVFNLGLGRFLYLRAARPAAMWSKDFRG